MLSAASGDRWEALYVVVLHTGLRRGEALGLLWEDVHLEEATLSVRRSLDVDGTLKTPKNPASRRTLKLAPRALAALKAHKVRQNEERLKAGDVWEDHNLVFPNTIGKPMNAGNFYRRELQPLLERAGLAGEGFTSTAFATLRYYPRRQGVHPSTAQKMLGHSDIRMTRNLHSRHGRDAGRCHCGAGEGLQLKSTVALLLPRGPASVAGVSPF